MKNEINDLLNNFSQSCKPSEVPWEQIKERIGVKEQNSIARWFFRYKKLISAIAGFATVIGGVLASASLFPTVAVALDKTPGINQVYDWLGDLGLNNAMVFDNKMHVSSRDRGITFTVTDAYYDQGRLALQYQVNLPNRMYGVAPSISNMDFYVDGKKINLTSTGSLGGRADNEWQGMSELYTNGLPKRFTLQIVIRKIGNARGYWQVQVPISGYRTSAHTKHYMPNITQIVNGRSISVKDITITPATVLVHYEFTGEERLDLAMYTDNGFPLETIESQMLSVRKVGGTKVWDVANMYDTLSKMPKSLYAIPQDIMMNPKLQTQSIPLSHSLPITIDEGVLGKVSIRNIKYDSSRTVLTMKYDGSLPFPINLALQKTNGKVEYIKPVSGYESDGHGQFTITYPAIKSTDYVQILSMHYNSTNLLTDFIIHVPLN